MATMSVSVLFAGASARAAASWVKPFRSFAISPRTLSVRAKATVIPMSVYCFWSTCICLAIIVPSLLPA
eukprot:2367603-Pyramimonas_sp.AAC.1